MSDVTLRCTPPPVVPAPILAAEAPRASPPPDATAASSAANLEIEDNGCSGRSLPLPFLLLYVADLDGPRDVLEPRMILLTASSLVVRRLC